MKSYLIGIVALFLFMSCGTESETTKEKEAVVENEVVAEEKIVQIDKPKNVVTPEYWENYDTDIEMVILFYKGDSLQDSERKIVEGLKEEFFTLEFHEFYSDDNLAQVFLNDTLAFDISNFMMDKDFGFVLLKPGVEPHYEFLNDSLSALKDNFRDFYGNK